MQVARLLLIQAISFFVLEHVPFSKTDLESCFIGMAGIPVVQVSDISVPVKSFHTGHNRIRNITAAIVGDTSDFSIVQILEVLHVNTQHPLTVDHLHKQTQWSTQLLFERSYT